MSQYQVKKSIAIHGTPGQVWDALTNPEKTKKYFFHCEVHSGWKPGDTITFKGKMFFFIDIEMEGKIIAAEPGKQLQYTLRNGKHKEETGNFSTVTDVLTYHNGITTLSITDDVGEGEGAEKRLEKSEEGWDKVLSGLKTLVEDER